VSLLQPHRRRSSDFLDLGSVGLGQADVSGSAMVLDRELDLSAERPAGGATSAKRGPGLLVAAIVASSLTLAGIILLVRSDANEAAVSQPAAPPPIADVSTAPAAPSADPSPVDPAATRRTPAAPSRVASQAVPPATRDSARAPVGITPTAIAPSRAAIQPPLAVGEVAPAAVDLPAPVFDEPTPEPTPPTIEDDGPEPLPGIEEPAELEAVEPEGDAVEPQAAASPSATAPVDLAPA
jgi:hypothetical protein